jgi:hypothetical protein
VVEKARKTARLLEALAKSETAFNPTALRAFVSATFRRLPGNAHPPAARVAHMPGLPQE